MTPELCRHLFVAGLVICALVIIETYVFFQLAEPVEADTTKHLIEQLSSILVSTAAPLPSALWPPDQKAVCDLLKDNTDDTNAQVKHRTAIMVVVMFACLVTLSVMLVTVTVVTGQEKLLIAGEVLAVCVAFFLFDWFFFKVVVAGTEPATAASLIDLAMQKFLSEVTLTKLRTADHCKSPPS